MNIFLYFLSIVDLFALFNLSNITYGNCLVIALFSSIFFLLLFYITNVKNYKNFKIFFVSFCFYLLYDVATLTPVGLNCLAFVFAMMLFVFFKERYRIEGLSLWHYILANALFFTFSHILSVFVFDISSFAVYFYQLVISTIIISMIYFIVRKYKKHSELTFVLR